MKRKNENCFYDMKRKNGFDHFKLEFYSRECGNRVAGSEMKTIKGVLCLEAARQAGSRASEHSYSQYVTVFLFFRKQL